MATNEKLIAAINSNEPFWEIKNKSATSADLLIYSTISRYGSEWGDVSSKELIQAVQDLGKIDRLNIHINSPGGSVSEGMAIKAFLSQQSFEKHVYIDSLCASIATAIAFGIGATVHMDDTALVMIHNAWTYASGNASELRKEADVLDKHDAQIRKIYVDRTAGNLTEDEIVEKMEAETWLDANECLDFGFIDEIISTGSQAAACIPEEYFDSYKNIPESIKIKNASEKNNSDNGVTAQTEAIIHKANLVLDEYKRRKENYHE